MSEKRKPFPLMQLRAFADEERHKLVCDRDRRGFWPGEETRHDFFEAVMALIDRVAADPVILDRLKKGSG